MKIDISITKYPVVRETEVPVGDLYLRGGILCLALPAKSHSPDYLYALNINAMGEELRAPYNDVLHLGPAVISLEKE